MSPTSGLAAEILEFWFGESLTSAQAARARSKVWFRQDPQFDAELTRRFADLPARALAGDFDAWAAEPGAAAARILLLDQLPRNIFRGTPAAFAYDAAAQVAATQAVDAGWDRQMHPLQAVFVYLPFEHAEDAMLQARALRCYQALQAAAVPGLETLFAGFTDYARRHGEVIERFGRFPHRNAILGRRSTPDELRYLQEGGERFGSSAT